MNLDTEGYRSVEQGSWRGAVAFAVAGLVAACFAPAWFSLAYRLAVFACLAPAMGCLALVLIHRVTGGQWASDLAPFLRAGAALLPWVWLFALPLLVLPPALGGLPEASLPALSYGGREMVFLRAIIYAALFFGFRWALSDGIGHDREPIRNSRPWVGPVGLIVLFFLSTLLTDDWIEALEAGWHSTAFAVVWLSGSVVMGLALALLGGLWSGAAPNSNGVSGRPVGLDWGNLLLTTVIFWCYVSYAQFLIIWAGNLPEETAWYLHRESGAWKLVIPAVGLCGFAIPFFLLLSRRLKRSASGLAWVSVLLMASQLAYLAWVILPAGGSLPLPGAIAAACLLVAALGMFMGALAGGARRLRKEAR